jgi:hypothetical protein
MWQATQQLLRAALHKLYTSYLVLCAVETCTIKRSDIPGLSRDAHCYECGPVQQYQYHTNDPPIHPLCIQLVSCFCSQKQH